MTAPVRHGYYLPLAPLKDGTPTGLLCGDEEYAERASEAWDALCGEFRPSRDGHPNPFGRYDGASVFDRPDGTTVTRVVLRDFFREGTPVIVRDL
jgi:hypothetical protein